jgi:hypothetical protein
MQVRPQYLSVVYHKIPGEAQWTVLSQCRTMSPEQTANKTEAARIGSKNKTTVYGALSTEVSLRLYTDHDMKEVARILGVAKPGGGWTGTESIQLDPTRIADLKIENYDGAETDATLLSTEYINRFKPGRFGHGLDSDEEGGRFVDCSGSADAYYIEPEAD